MPFMIGYMGGCVSAQEPFLAAPHTGRRTPNSPCGCMRTASTPFLPERLRREFDLPWGLRQRAEFRSATAGLRAALPLVPSHIRYWPHYDMAIHRMAGSEDSVL